MSIISQPIYAVIDSSVMSKMAADYWHSDSKKRRDVRDTINQLSDSGIHFALSAVQIGEMLRYENEQVANDRFNFLRELPLVAWVKPFDNSWFAGSDIDLMIKEAALLSKNSELDFEEIRSQVRSDAWQTGVGQDLFHKDSPAWDLFRRICIEGIPYERNVASVTHVDPTGIEKMTLSHAWLTFR